MKHNPNIKKISTAMERGNAIAHVNGIKRTTGDLVDFDEKGNLTCACAAGMALIGKVGIKAIEDKHKENLKNIEAPFGDTEYNPFGDADADFVEWFNKEFKADSTETPECLLNAPKGKTAKLFMNEPSADTVYGFIWHLNDNARTPVLKIAQYLKSCGF